MPRLINYLNQVVPGRAYDEFDITRLQQIYERACDFLAVPIGDPRRETIAVLVFDLEGTTDDNDEFVSLLVSAFHRMA